MSRILTGYAHFLGGNLSRIDLKELFQQQPSFESVSEADGNLRKLKVAETVSCESLGLLGYSLTMDSISLSECMEALPKFIRVAVSLGMFEEGARSSWEVKIGAPTPPDEKPRSNRVFCSEIWLGKTIWINADMPEADISDAIISCKPN